MNWEKKNTYMSMHIIWDCEGCLYRADAITMTTSDRACEVHQTRQPGTRWPVVVIAIKATQKYLNIVGTTDSYCKQTAIFCNLSEGSRGLLVLWTDSYGRTIPVGLKYFLLLWAASNELWVHIFCPFPTVPIWVNWKGFFFLQENELEWAHIPDFIGWKEHN